MQDALDDYIQIYRIRCLFRAVLVKAAKDAFLIKKRNLKTIKYQKDALSFFENEADLKMICQMAGVEYTDIVEPIHKKMKKSEKYEKIILCVLGKC